MSPTRLMLLLLMVCAARTGLSLKLYKAESLFSCINAALSEAEKSRPEENSLVDKRSFDSPPGKEAPSLQEEEKEEEKEKRTFAGDARYKYLSQAQLKGKMYQNRAKTDRRTKFTLSLDVPTNIMNILFDIAKAKNLRAKAAANAHLMAQIGRRK
ncbi:urocortin-3 [Trachemys scripta elegans]|uniref:urocortin-3 n=1 Tax=Trachemys scripta elegans TaxID=31138 RepID=UPI001557535E|nr:urocortin-3 [Trachemys scripta elegans]